MNVPNHERKAFRDMTPEERSAIVEAWLAGDVEYYSHASDDWQEKGNSGLYSETVYRTRPRQLVIPWDVIREDIAWFLISPKGRKWGITQSCYGTKPVLDEDGWTCDGGSSWFSLDGLNIDTTGIDWRESLTARPEGV